MKKPWNWSGTHKTVSTYFLSMSEVIYEFEDGPYDVLKYTVKMEDGKAVIEQNENDLGRLTIESLDAVENLREALEKVEAELKEAKRRQEEL